MQLQAVFAMEIMKQYRKNLMAPHDWFMNNIILFILYAKFAKIKSMYA